MDNNKDSIVYCLFYKLNCLSFMYFKIKSMILFIVQCTPWIMKKNRKRAAIKKIDKELFEIKIELFP